VLALAGAVAVRSKRCGQRGGQWPRDPRLPLEGSSRAGDRLFSPQVSPLLRGRTALPGQGNMSRRKQTTPNKVHCEYDVTQRCGSLALAGLLGSEVGRRGVMERCGSRGSGGCSCFTLGIVRRETELCALGEPRLCRGVAGQG